MFFEPEFVLEVRQRADILSVIQEYVDMKKKGNTYMGKCPFHQEKSPSFAINKREQYFNCFGCKTGGSVFKFLMLHLGIGFPEAVEMVANRYGIAIPEQKGYSEEVKKKREEKKKAAMNVVILNNAVFHEWRRNLQANATVTKYLRDRGVSEETEEYFGLGFSDEKWTSDSEFLLGMKALPLDLIEAGIATRGEKDGKLYDRFHNRLMFPIRDERGGIVAFGGRVLGDEQPKYLNSPETPAYVKGNHLYGLYENRASIKESGFAILVEGYMDLISLYQAGIKNVVASLGTALTENQAALLSRHTSNVVINYDGDKAGVSAARKAISPLISAGLNVKVFILPGKQDPDDFVRAHGARNYQIARVKGYSYLDFFLKNSDLDNKSERIMEAVELIASVDGEIERRDAFDSVMSFFKVNEVETKKGLWDIVKANAYKLSEVEDYLEQIDKPKPKIAELRLLELISARQEIRDYIIPVLDETDYNKLILSKHFEEIVKGNQIKDSRLNIPVIDDEEPLDEFLIEAEDCLQVLRGMALDDKIGKTKELIKKYEEEKDEEKTQQQLIRFFELVKMRRRSLIYGDV